MTTMTDSKADIPVLAGPPDGDLEGPSVNRRIRLPQALDNAVEAAAERNGSTAHSLIVRRLAESFTLPDASRRRGRLETEQLFALMLATAAMAETRLGIENWMDDERTVELVFDAARNLIAMGRK